MIRLLSAFNSEVLLVSGRGGGVCLAIEDEGASEGAGEGGVGGGGIRTGVIEGVWEF